jgi:hypothetical protein
MAEHGHDHDHSHEDSYGIALGFRIFEHDNQFFFVEAEITPYVDEPDALGATLVFHPLKGIDPTDMNEQLDWPAWPTDIDDDLTRDSSQPSAAQFQAIVRQLSSLSEDRLREYLQQAREEAEE